MAHPPYRWIQVTDQAAFPGRDGAGALVHHGAMYLIGGWSKRDAVAFPRICSNDVWRSTDGLDWQQIKPNTFRDDTFDGRADWEGRHTAGYVVHDDAMWIIGGDANQGHYQPDCWRSRDGVTWELVCEELPFGYRVLHYSVAMHGRIYVMGGQHMSAPFIVTDQRPDTYYNDVWSSTDGRHWEQLATEGAIWPARGMIGGHAVFRDRIWVLGGGTYDTRDHPQRLFYNDVWSSADGKRWTCHLENAPWHPRQYHEVAVFDDKLWVLEGWNKANRNDVWYSPDGVNWHELPGTPWAVRHAASVFVYDDALWMVAGNNMQPDVWKLVRA